MAAARGGRRRGHDGEREGEGKGDGKHRELTLEVMVRTARSGEAGVDGEVLDGAAARAEKNGEAAAIKGLPARSGRTGRKRRTRQ